MAGWRLRLSRGERLMSQEQAQPRQETVGLMVEAGLPTEERGKAGGADTGN